MRSLAICAAFSVIVLQGCANMPAELMRDRRDAAHDPPRGRQLFEQLPAWDGAADKICCGHLRECQPHQSPRC
jgi:hypothetical protein